MNLNKYYIGASTIFLALCITVSSHAAPGQLDTTFGVNGFTTTTVTNNPNYANSVAIQTDGKIIAVGYTGSFFAIRRYNSDGSLDAAFNANAGLAPPNGAANSVAIQTDGKIVVAGHDGNGADLDFKILRYNANGTLDTSFDGDGVVVTPVGPGYDVGYSIAFQTDGKILVSGRSDSSPSFVTSYAIVRYNANGSLDTTFDADGIVIVPMPGNAITDSLLLQADGKIVVAHNTYTGSAYILAVLRYNTDGSLDSTFDGDGIVTAPVGTNVEEASLAIQTDGKLVVACSSYTSDALHYDFWVVRFNSNGSPDMTFGTNGQTFTPIGAGAAQDKAKSVAIQANGKIVVGGFTLNISNYNFAVVRYNRNGSLDSRWGNGGIVINDFGGDAESVNSIAIQTNGRIVAAGASDIGSPGVRKFALARYLGDTGENFDFDRDGNSDISVYRPSEGIWYVLGSASGAVSGVKWGVSGDEIASADYDGDLKTDFAVWHSGSLAYLYILNSSNSTARIEQFGQTNDDPSIVGDYDG
ncbi:MAG: hypothetical protein ABJB34_10525, partial [Acidobacteriota bacterium]